jgi:predicted ATPase
LATQVVVAPASPVIVALPGEILYTSEKEKEMIQKRTNEKGRGVARNRSRGRSPARVFDRNVVLKPTMVVSHPDLDRAF